jgi:hypothetical protein
MAFLLFDVGLRQACFHKEAPSTTDIINLCAGFVLFPVIIRIYLIFMSN